MSDDARISGDEIAERSFQRDISLLREDLVEYQRRLAGRLDLRLALERAC